MRLMNLFPQAKRTGRILVLGELLLDFIPTQSGMRLCEPGTVVKTVSGSAGIFACAAAALDAGAGLVKTAIAPMDAPTTEHFAAYLSARGESRGLRWNLRTTELSRAAAQLRWLLQSQRSSGSPFDSGVSDGAGVVCLTAGDDAGEVVKVVRRLGYDLSEEDNARIYEAFQRIAASKHFVSTRELDAIVASTASPFKFCNSVLEALGETGIASGLDALDQLTAKTGQPAPAPLAGLRDKAVRFTRVVEKDHMVDAVLSLLE